MSKSKRPRLLHVQWDDSGSSNGVWRRENDLRNDRPMQCQTVGWVVHETKDHMTLASSWCNTGSGLDYSGDMTIPKAVIRKKRRL